LVTVTNEKGNPVYQITKGTQINVLVQSSTVEISKIKITVGEVEIYTSNEEALGNNIQKSIKVDDMNNIQQIEFDNTYKITATATTKKGAVSIGTKENIVDRTIGSTKDIKKLARQVNEGNSFKYHTIYFVSDITTGETWEPIGYWNGEIGTPSGKYFSGVFEGNQHTITIPSITQDTDSYKSSGLFGNIKEATIQDLTIKGNLVNKDCGYIGSISGISYDSIITNCLNRANVKGYFGTGGIVGAVEAGNINNCQNTGTISSTKEMPSDWKDSCAGYAVAGGIVGTQIGGLVEKCYNFGIVNSENINKSLLGGISGYSQANIQYCGNEENITWSGNINRKYLYGRNCWMCVRRSRYLSIL